MARKKQTKTDTSANEEIDLSVGKLPTITTEEQAKRPKFADRFIYPNSNGPSRVLFSGPSRAGKTNFAMSLLTDNRHMSGFFNFIVVFCPSAGMQADYDHLRQKYPEERLQIIDFSIANLEEEIEIAKERAEQCKQDNVRPPQTLFLFDDLIKTPGFDKGVATLCTKSRQWAISVWVLTQSLMALSRLMRLQASNIFAFAPTKGEMARLAEECNNIAADEDTVTEMLRQSSIIPFQPFHFCKTDEAHKQYRIGLTEFFDLKDPTKGYTQNIDQKEKEEHSPEQDV